MASMPICLIYRQKNIIVINFKKNTCEKGKIVLYYYCYVKHIDGDK